MLTPAEYAAMPDTRKRDFALAVDALERMCADCVAMMHRAQSAAYGAQGEAERWEIATMCKRNEIFARQFEFAMSGLPVQIATDDRGYPIRVRRPLGFVSLAALAAKAQAQAEPSPLPNGGRTKARRAK